MIPVSDPDDPRVGDYRNVRDRDLVSRDTFMAEGRLVVRALLSASSRYRARSVLVTPAALEGVRDAVEGAPHSMPVYLAEQRVMDGIVGFPIHRGCLAAGESGPPVDPWHIVDDASRAPRPRLVVLEGTLNHDNVGAVFRNAAAFGVGGVLLSPGCCSPLYRKAIRVSMGAALRVPWAVLDDWAGGLGRLGGEGWGVVALTTEPSGVELGVFAASPSGRGPLALLLGAEGPGLSAGAVAQAGHRVRIPMAPGTDSLNVATAGAIALYALSV